MSWKKTLRDNILTIDWDKKHKVTVRVVNKKKRNLVVQTIEQNKKALTSGWSTEKEFIKGEGSGKEFKLLMAQNGGGEVLYNNLQNIISDASLDKETPLPKEEPAPEPAPGPGKIDTTTTKVSGTYSGGQVSGTYSGGQASVPSDSSVQGVPLSGSNNKTMFIVAGAVVLLMLIILLLWRRK